MALRKHCKICEKEGSEVFSRSYRNIELENFFLSYYGNSTKINEFLNSISNDFYTLLKCERCEFVWQKFSLEIKDQKVLYDEIIDQNSSINKSLFLEKRDKDYQLRELNFFKNYFEKKSNIKILDYGAGWGGWLKNIKQNFKNIHALEFSENKIKILKNNEIRVLSFEELKNKNFKFDFIRLEQVLEHLDDVEFTLKLLSQICQNSSLVYISVPNSKKLFKKNWEEHLIAKGPAQPLEHLNSFTHFSLNKLLAKYNFRKLSVLSLFFLFVKNKKFNYVNIKYFLKTIYNNFFGTSLVLSKIDNSPKL